MSGTRPGKGAPVAPPRDSALERADVGGAKRSVVRLLELGEDPSQVLVPRLDL